MPFWMTFGISPAMVLYSAGLAIVAAVIVGETLLPLLIALLFGRADLGAAVSDGRRRGISGCLNSERTHHERSEIVGAAHTAPPVGRRRIEQEAVRGTGHVRKRANEARLQSRFLHTGQQVDRAHDRVGRRLCCEHGARVRGEPFRDLLGAFVGAGDECLPFTHHPASGTQFVRQCGAHAMEHRQELVAQPDPFLGLRQPQPLLLRSTV